MSLKTIVKVSHVSNLSDARYCAGMGVAMLGVQVIAQADNFMPPEVFHDIRGWLAGPQIVAELYGISSAEEVYAAIEAYAPDYLELTLEEYRRFGADLPLPCLVNVGNLPTDLSFPGGNKIRYLIAGEGASCGTLPTAIPLLAQVTSLPSLTAKLGEGCFAGVVLPGPKESRPGTTNYDELGTLLEALEEE